MLVVADMAAAERGAADGCAVDPEYREAPVQGSLLVLAGGAGAGEELGWARYLDAPRYYKVERSMLLKHDFNTPVKGSINSEPLFEAWFCEGWYRDAPLTH